MPGEPEAKETSVASTRPAPYVGVSGIVSTGDQSRLEQVAGEVGLLDRRRLLLGVKAVHKTQFLDVENKYGPQWYPVGAGAIAGALRPSTGTLPVAQVYLDVEHVEDAAYREAFITRLRQRCGAWLGGVQFDLLPWHADPAMPGFLARVKEKLGVPVLVQCHSPAMSALGPSGAAAALSQLAPTVDYLLFDSSHGTGTRLDRDALLPFVEAAYEEVGLSRCGIGVAGGLSSDAVLEDLPGLLAAFPDLSWDAEGALHPVRTDGTRPLDLDLAESYLRSCAQVLRAAGR